jgi:hypothetical protein
MKFGLYVPPFCSDLKRSLFCLDVPYIITGFWFNLIAVRGGVEPPRVQKYTHYRDRVACLPIPPPYRVFYLIFKLQYKSYYSNNIYQSKDNKVNQLTLFTHPIFIGLQT